MDTTQQDIPLAARPDFVVVGVPAPGGRVMLFASTQLTHAELLSELTHHDDIEFRLLSAPRPPTVKYTLTAAMRAFVMVVGDTYQDAFLTLLRQWTPPEADDAPVRVESTRQAQIERGPL